MDTVVYKRNPWSSNGCSDLKGLPRSGTSCRSSNKASPDLTIPGAPLVLPLPGSKARIHFYNHNATPSVTPMALEGRWRERGRSARSLGNREPILARLLSWAQSPQSPPPSARARTAPSDAHPSSGRQQHCREPAAGTGRSRDQAPAPPKGTGRRNDRKWKGKCNPRRTLLILGKRVLGERGLDSVQSDDLTYEYSVK
ncbi:uncharacterized protein LOC129146778 isoform X2 [Talpa occidentalis]|uniref:uncharacterized protein LOC129146778 isoform X2 n=1 Tax=Talpa occidentalis TaxID=50954 RepID=UPI0023F643A6|nr:uncharacterized protein LOC129146778 isoform X2 [Talpa occidentalis]